jgi:hypothetical protein
LVGLRIDRLSPLRLRANYECKESMERVHLISNALRPVKLRFLKVLLAARIDCEYFVNQAVLSTGR